MAPPPYAHEGQSAFAMTKHSTKAPGLQSTQGFISSGCALRDRKFRRQTGGACQERLPDLESFPPMSLLEFALLAPVSIFVIVNPFSTIPVFLGITPGDSEPERIATARTATIVAGGVMLFFAITGQVLFSFLGITMAAFEIAGGALLFVIAFDMLRSPESEVRITQAERELAARKDDVAITPLAVPLLCGPGAISTVIILQTQADTLAHRAVLVAAVAFVYLLFFVILAASAKGAGRLSPIVLRVVKRLMGLLFAAIAIQFIINGIEGLPFIHVPPAPVQGR